MKIFFSFFARLLKIKMSFEYKLFQMLTLKNVSGFWNTSFSRSTLSSNKIYIFVLFELTSKRLVSEWNVMFAVEIWGQLEVTKSCLIKILEKQMKTIIFCRKTFLNQEDAGHQAINLSFLRQSHLFIWPFSWNCQLFMAAIC